MKEEVRHFSISLRRLYKSILGFEEGTDIEATTEGIKRDIGFKGHTAWILVFSILIASIGLNVNSTAVVIGAMLISPLMGPILGIGLAVGTNDIETLIRALKNLGIAIFISLLTSTLYFIITPLSVEQSELLSRTTPTFLDVLVALFGGFAGIIAGSRREKTNVIPGVAIATALMPPLCTAGYGLANLKFHYFLGAFYLFFINSVFISISTFIIVRYLKFPLIKWVSQEKWNKYKIILYAFLIITITPSTIIFFHVIQENRFKISAEDFVKTKCKFEGSELLSSKIIHSDSISSINLYYIGEEIDETKKMYLEEKLSDYQLTGNKWNSITERIELKIHQEADNKIDFDAKLSEINNDLRLKILDDLYTKNEEKIQSKEEKIKLLEEDVIYLEKEILKLHKKDTIPYVQIAKEMSYHFPIIKKFSYSDIVEVDVNKPNHFDTVPVFLLQMKRGYKYSYRKKQLKKAEEWLRIRIKNNKIKTIAY